MSFLTSKNQKPMLLSTLRAIRFYHGNRPRYHYYRGLQPPDTFWLTKQPLAPPTRSMLYVRRLNILSIGFTACAAAWSLTMAFSASPHRECSSAVPCSVTYFGHAVRCPICPVDIIRNFGTEISRAHWIDLCTSTHQTAQLWSVKRQQG